MRWVRLAAIALALLSTAPAFSVQPDEILSDPVLEARARQLSKQLRCMVCQSQSIDDSDAPLARDLRVLVRERLQAGDSDDKVLDFLTVRYGDCVLLKPRFSPGTAVLWLTPIGVLLVGVIGLVALARRKRADSADAAAPELTPGEAQRVAALREDE